MASTTPVPGLPPGVTDPCIHCGFCLPTCASYRVLGTEMDSPRGRIHTLKAIEAGELSLDATVASHFDSCLGCLACVSACPSGVRYDQLIEATRPKLNKAELRSPWQQSFRHCCWRCSPTPNGCAPCSPPCAPTQEDRSRPWPAAPVCPAGSDPSLPPLAAEGFRDRFPLRNPARGERRGRVGLVLGCVQRCFDPDVNEATVAVLQANGFEVVIPADQGCCGAVSHHQGQLEQTRELASDLVRSFEAAAGVEGLDAVLVAASGCGFPCPVLDVHEFLAARGLSDGFRRSLQPLPIAVAYHDACHMIHGQGITAQPRQLLRAIPELELREATEAGVCCGSAGIYNLVQPAEAAELGQIKAQDLSGTGASVIASANIGCSLQLRRHLEVDGPEVLHPMQLLARSAGLSAPQNDCPPGEHANQRINAERRRSIA